MKIFYLFVFFILSLCLVSSIPDYNEYYEINLNYKNGSVFYESSEIVLTNRVIENQFGLWDLSFYDINGNFLNLVSFSVSPMIYVDSFDSTGVVDVSEKSLNDFSFVIYAPYYKNASFARIHNENSQEIERFSVLMFSENVQSNKILIDYMQKSEKNVLEIDENQNEVIDNKIVGQEEVENKKTVLDFWWILVFVFLVLLIVFIMKIFSKK